MNNKTDAEGDATTDPKGKKKQPHKSKHDFLLHTSLGLT